VLQFILKRLTGALLLLLLIATLSFFLSRFAPGGPFDKDRKISTQARINLEKKYNLDRPLFTRYLLYMKKLVLQGDFGDSFTYKNLSVNEILAEHAPYSFLLGGLALLTALTLAIPLGIVAAEYPEKGLDRLLRTSALFFISMPGIVLGPLSIILFSFGLGLVPSGLWRGASHLVLPVMTLALPFGSRVFLLTREKAVSVFRSEFALAARARGVSRKRLLFTHVLKNSLIPVTAYIAPGTAALLTGSVVIEQIYVLPGLGKYFVQSAFNRDYFLMSGVIIVYFGLLVIMNMLADIAVHYLDPRAGAVVKAVS